jgi:hypothetical protein
VADYVKKNPVGRRHQGRIRPFRGKPATRNTTCATSCWAPKLKPTT